MSLSDTLARLSAAAGARMPHAGEGRLADFPNAGSNPGALRARIHRPDGLAPGAALVVVLHGCTQTAAGYDIGAGWSEMADRHGFMLLFPEQQRANNPNLCFNWFSAEDNRRGRGEASSIREMIDAAVADYALDPARVFITGLSAGGAMALVMLATYPELFAGGAIIAGLPYGVAAGVPQALERMRGQGLPAAATLAAAARDAADHMGAWPTLSVWHGTADATVHPDNADAIVAQWRALHHLPARPDRIEQVDGHTRRLWRDASGQAVIEQFSVAGLGHGTPLATAGADGCGRAGPFLLEAGISSTRHICRFWGLAAGQVEPADADPRADVAASAPTAMTPQVPVPVAKRLIRMGSSAAPPPPPTGGDVGAVIERALRAAGLMR